MIIKDVIFFTLLGVWIIGAMYMVMNCYDPFILQMTMLVVFGLLTVYKVRKKSFNKWLNKELCGKLF